MSAGDFSVSPPLARESGLPRAPTPVRLAFAVASLIAPTVVSRFVASRMFTPRRSNRSRAVPQATRTFCVAHNAWQLAVSIWGRQAPVVLLLHGWEGQSADWSDFVQPLLDAGLSVCTFDAPAHGKSTGTQTDVWDYAKAIHRVIGEIGAPAAIVAHSMGAAAGSIYLSELTSGMPRALVFLAPAGDLGREISQISYAIGLSSAAERHLRERVQKQVGCALAECSTSRALSTLQISPLVIHDVDDRVVPVDATHEIGARVKGSRVLITTGLGHRAILRSKDVISVVIGHIRSLV